MYSIDINCDMGEGMPDDGLLMPYISSANIACGYHAGDEDTIRRTIDLCLQHKVAIGIHPSFNDRENFGRTEMQLPDDELFNLVSEQLFLFDGIARSMAATINHVKPHGALYNLAARNSHVAGIVVKAVTGFNSAIRLYGLAGSCLLQQARLNGLKVASEVFADRTYQQNGSLTPRTNPLAVHNKEFEAVNQVMQMVLQKQVSTLDGCSIPIAADTICLHGDGPMAVPFAKAIHAALVEANIKIAAL